MQPTGRPELECKDDDDDDDDDENRNRQTVCTQANQRGAGCAGIGHMEGIGHTEKSSND
jgi:hypothetical protein